MKSKVKCFLAAALLWAVVAGAEETGLLFKADFDSYNVTADFSKGSGKCSSFVNPDLQLRMFPGLKNEGNAVCLGNDECCEYEMKDNFDPRQGTVTLWAAPQNWKPGETRVQHFFEAKLPGFWMLVYKYEWSNYLFFYIQFPQAPGTEKIFTATARAEDADWPSGKWHRIDATWDSTGMRLYVDGVIPAPTALDRQPPTKSEIKFPQPLVFPEATAAGVITIGTPQHVRSNKSISAQDKTAFDGVRVYDRALSAAEIKADYEKLFPSKFALKRKTNLLTIPSAASGIQLDGKIGESEWSDAALVPIAERMPFSGDAKVVPPKAMALVKRDAQNLFLGLVSDKPCKFRLNHKKNDSALWEDDGFEVLLKSPSSDVYHFIVNGNGAVYDDKNSDKKFDAKAETAVKNGPDGCIVEMRIPLQSLGSPAPGQEWKGNFNLTYSENEPGKTAYYGWNTSASSSGYMEESNFGGMRWGADDLAFRLEKVGDLSAGALDLSLRAAPPKTTASVEAVVLSESGARADFKELPGKEWKSPLAAGQHILSVSGRNSAKQEVFRFEKAFYVNFPMEVGHTCLPLQGRVDVRVDLNNSGADTLAAVRSGGLKGRVELARDGKVFSKADFTAKTSLSLVQLPLPENLEAGTYAVRAEVSVDKMRLRREAPLRVPDMTPYKEKVGDDHSVPDPWTPIVREGEKKFKLLDREYVFGDGPAPRQVVSKGTELLRQPPKWIVDTGAGGAEILWSDFKEDAAFDDFVSFSGKGAAPGLAFKWKGELWFDGLYKLELQMSPEGKTNIKSLRMTWSVPSECARFVMTPLCEKWSGDRVEKRFEILQPNTNRDFFVWLTGREKGFLWWPKSPANWVNKDGERQVVITRGPETTEARVDIISVPATLEKTAEYTMAFMGTPAKSPPENFRKFNFSGWAVTKNQNAQIMGSGVFDSKRHGDDTSTPVSHVPANWDDYRKSVDWWKKKGIAPFMYAMPAQLSSLDPEYDYFFPSWAKTPTYVHKVTKEGASFTCEPCCGHTSVTDLMAWRTKDLCEKIPDIGGLYYDLSDIRHCENRVHGCGGVDAFGKPYLSSIAYNLRLNLMRIYKILHRQGKILIPHAHSLFNPVAHTFGDYWWPGEQYYYPLAENPDHFYCENITLDEYQSELSWKTKGVGIMFLPQYGRSSQGIASLKARERDFMQNPEWAIRVITPLLLHDVSMSAEWVHFQTVGRLWVAKDGANVHLADFHGYWEGDAVKSASPKVLASWYSWKTPSPYSHMLLVGNMGRDEQPAALSLDKKALGLDGGNAKYYDLWNGEGELSEADLATIKIKGNHFLLIGIK